MYYINYLTFRKALISFNSTRVHPASISQSIQPEQDNNRSLCTRIIAAISCWRSNAISPIANQTSPETPNQPSTSVSSQSLNLNAPLNAEASQMLDIFSCATVPSSLSQSSIPIGENSTSDSLEPNLTPHLNAATLDNQNSNLEIDNISHSTWQPSALDQKIETVFDKIISNWNRKSLLSSDITIERNNTFWTLRSKSAIIKCSLRENTVQNGWPLDDSYLMETLGVRVYQSEVHFYRDTLREVVAAWRDSDLEISLEDYICDMWDSRVFDSCELGQYKVWYFSSAELNAHKTSITNGVTNLFPGKYMFVFVRDPTTQEAIFYTASKAKFSEQGRLQHSSFLRGNAVEAAGMVEIDDKGRILTVSNESGHYKCNEAHMYEILNYVSKQGCNLAKITIKLYNTEDFSQFTADNSLSWFNEYLFLETLKRDFASSEIVLLLDSQPSTPLAQSVS